ncbi:MAG: iron-containing alcohol dehydrogenase [Candidatus Hodarchaeales archaeon]|jgi:alcohol dehydrogenase
MIPSYFEFTNPVRIIAGQKALDNLSFELSQLQAQKPLILTDQGVKNAGLIKEVKNAFKETDITFSLFEDVKQDSSEEVVLKIAILYRETNSDSLIAVGGGSVIDTAKAVNVLVSENSDDLMQFAGAEVLKKPLKPLLVIPTTSGTGSEATGVAVIKDHKRNIKMGFSNHYMIPNVAILDPRMTLTLPPLITAATGMDALTHAIESYYCLQKNPVSDSFAWSAAKIISENLIPGIKKPNDKRIRFSLSLGAFLAGVSLSNSIAGMVHSLGHATGGICGVPHGIAMNIFLPHGIEYNFTKVSEIFGELLLPLTGAEVFAQTPKKKRPNTALQYINDLRDRLYDLTKLPRTLKEANVSKSEFETIAKAAINDGSVAFNPEDMDYEDALKVLEKAYN